MQKRLSEYRAEIRRRLITNHNWTAERFNTFTSKYPDYLKAMWESASPIADTVYFISEMSEEQSS